MLRPLALLLAAAPLLLPGAPAAAQHDRIPKDWKRGRCLLQIGGKTYISGVCAYKMGRDGSFEMHGPHQIWGGIDYPKPRYFIEERSNDHFVQVDPLDGVWSGSWNENKLATHAQDQLGELTRKGACWVNATVRVCLWK